MKRQKRNKRIVIGLTGGFGTGKTTVARMLAAAGARRIDADRISHDLLRDNKKIYTAVVRLFGRQVIGKDQAIDRAKLAGIVFGDARTRRRLERILHPEIIKTIKQKVLNAREKIVVLEAALLFEAGAQGLVDTTVVVTASLNKRIERIMRKTTLTRQQVLARIRSQLPLQTKVRMADFVIDNNGTKAQTRKQAAKLKEDVWKN